MITVNCPQCNVENSALSRHCIACGSELLQEGYVRCQNCRALTPSNLEFCELCGSFLAAVSTPDSHDHLTDSDDGLDEGSGRELTPTPISDDEAGADAGALIPTSEIDAGESELPEDKPLKDAETEIPGWLLDVDAALKAGRDKEKAKDELRGLSPDEMASVHDDPVRRMETSELPDQPPDTTGALDWLSALEKKALIDAASFSVDDETLSDRPDSGDDPGDSEQKPSETKASRQTDKLSESGFGRQAPGCAQTTCRYSSACLVE
jgi:hypothetical protein